MVTLMKGKNEHADLMVFNTCSSMILQTGVEIPGGQGV